jgi:hypothetical protein
VAPIAIYINIVHKLCQEKIRRTHPSVTEYTPSGQWCNSWLGPAIAGLIGPKAKLLHVTAAVRLGK